MVPEAALKAGASVSADLGFLVFPSDGLSTVKFSYHAFLRSH